MAAGEGWNIKNKHVIKHDDFIVYIIHFLPGIPGRLGLVWPIWIKEDVGCSRDGSNNTISIGMSGGPRENCTRINKSGLLEDRTCSKTYNYTCMTDGKNSDSTETWLSVWRHLVNSGYCSSTYIQSFKLVIQISTIEQMWELSPGTSTVMLVHLLGAIEYLFQNYRMVVVFHATGCRLAV